MLYTDLRLEMMMWITVMLFNKVADSAQTNEISQPTPVIAADVGDNVTLHCFRLREGSSGAIVWYKQKVGHEPCVMVTTHHKPSYEDEFKSPKFSVEKERMHCHLKISNVDPSDEAMYYCGLRTFLTRFGNGTFLSVKGDGGVKVSVSQISVLDSVPAGASVTLQCSVLSESRAAELQVLWFRAPPQSHPQIIYTHHNSANQCESASSTHTCVYNFSKNILSLNDTGTYYCAVAVCGKIIFGNGTRVQLENDALTPVVICLGTVLVMCGVLISVQAVLLCKRQNCPQYRERIPHDVMINTEKTNTQDRGAAELNYAALHFNERKTKRVRENRGRSQDSLYSEVKSSTNIH